MKNVLGEDAEFKSMVDTGELIDVAVAARAGIGFIGRNGLLIQRVWFLCLSGRNYN